MNQFSKSSTTRNNKDKLKNQKTRSKRIKKKHFTPLPVTYFNRAPQMGVDSKHHRYKKKIIQQFDLYLKEINKLKGLDNETVYKIIKGGNVFSDAWGGITSAYNKGLYTVTTELSSAFSGFFNNPILVGCLKFLKNTAISIFEVLKSFFQMLRDIIVDIWNYNTNSKWFWIIITLISVGLFDWITVGFFSTSGLGALITGYNTQIASFLTVTGGLQNFNMITFIFNIVCFLFSNGFNIIFDFINLTGLIPGGQTPMWLMSIVWTLLISTGLIGWYEKSRHDTLNPVARADDGHVDDGHADDGHVDDGHVVDGHAGGGKKSSTFKLQDIPHSKIAEMEKEDPLKLAMAQFSGYIKTNEKGEYYFTEQADKSMNVLLKTSVSVINENCKEDDCLQATDVDKMNAFQFVHIANMHAISRKNTEEKIGGKKISNSIQNVVKHLKKEDIEWLGEKYPEQLKSAKQLGLLVDNKLTKVACMVLTQSDTINGKKIVLPLKKLHSVKLSSSSSESS
jgi:hypothetical protein